MREYNTISRLLITARGKLNADELIRLNREIAIQLSDWNLNK
jgi:hypothetical protein